MRLPGLAATLALLLTSGIAVAAPDIKGQLALYESEARALASNLPQPNQMSTQVGQRRLVDAQVAFSSGDYDAASLILFDLVGKTGGQDKEIATYYLAEALYQKGDRGAARGYFQTFVKMTTSASKWYQPAQQRIVEIAIVDNDTASADEAIAALNNLSGGLRLPSVPYIQGKYAFSQGKYDDALGLFGSVPKGSDSELQALYYSGTTHVAKKDLAKATESFTDLTNRKPRTNTDRRVIELAQLALGRIYYEREQPSKSIDSYLLVDRKSDLFPAALYEVSWVYVKNKQYDKALTTLELLGRLDPQSTKTPTVKILEGNLRIRKAQLLRQAQIAGTLSADERSDPPTEYAKAEKLFTETHDLYLPSYMALTRMVEGTLDPASFIDQISGRNTRVFASAAPIPEAAAQWLREEPEVQRVVNVEGDLADVQRNIDQSTAIIDRLEGVIATGDRLTLYPALSARRMRIAAIQHHLIGIRSELAEQAIRGGASSAGTGNRKGLEAQYTTLGDPERAYGDRTSSTQAGFDKVGDAAHEIESVIMSTQAMAVAIRTFAVTLPDDQRGTVQAGIDEATKEARAIEDELAEVQKEIVLGKDLAGVGDQDLLRARELRAQVKAAQDVELRSFNRAPSPLADQAARIAAQLEQADGQIDQLVARGLAEVKGVLEQERKNIVEYKKQLAEYEAEARNIGAGVLAASFKDVKAKFYDVVIRTDVGNVDVSWSQKEDSDDDLKRLNLARSRDLKQLRDEFRFVLDETVPTPSAPKTDTPAPTEGSSNPESGPSTRLKPAGDQPKGTTQPVVKPDNTPAPAPAPKTAPKKAGAK